MIRSSRRAERFAAALDADHGQTGAGDAETDHLTGLAHRLGALQVPGPRPAARAAALAAFVAGAAELGHHAAAPAAHAAAQTGTHTAGRGAAHAAGRSAGHAIGHTAVAHGLLVPVAVILGATAVVASGVGVAAHLSLPGDPFYAVKRATESVQLDLAGGGVGGARERLAIAHTRLAEIRHEAGFAPSALRTARITSLVTSLDHDVAASSGPMLSAGGATTAAWRDAVAEFWNGLVALPVDARTPAVLSSESRLRTVWGLAGGIRLPGAPSGTASGGGPGTGPSGTLPSTGPTTGPSTLLPTTLPTPGRPASGPLSGSLPTTGPTLPSVLPSGLPSGRPSVLPTVLPTEAPSEVPSVLPSLPVPLPTAVSSIIGGLLGQ